VTVRYTREGPVAWLTIDRPEARHALSAAVRAGLWDGVRRFFGAAAAVLVLTGAGDRAFCAGGDLEEMADAAREVPPPGSGRSGLRSGKGTEMRPRKARPDRRRVARGWGRNEMPVSMSLLADDLAAESAVLRALLVPLAVALNDVGGFRNTMTLLLTGLDVEAKAARAEELLFAVLGGKERFAEVDVRRLRFDRPDAPSNEQATAHLRVTVQDPDPRKVGRAFSNATMELALGGCAGFHTTTTTTPPTAESAFGEYRPAAVSRTAVTQVVVLPGGERRVIPGPPTVVHGLLGDGVASSTRPHPQAKGLGEYLRSRVVDVPEVLL
jgi:Enoyl-CoA hydratase/isomerase